MFFSKAPEHCCRNPYCTKAIYPIDNRYEYYSIIVPEHYISVAWRIFTSAIHHMKHYELMFPSLHEEYSMKYNENMILIDGIALLYEDLNKSTTQNITSVVNIYHNICEIKLFKIKLNRFLSKSIVFRDIHCDSPISFSTVEYLNSSNNNQMSYSIRMIIKNGYHSQMASIFNNNIQAMCSIFIDRLKENQISLIINENRVYSGNNKQYQKLIQDFAFIFLIQFNKGISGLISFTNIDNDKTKKHILNLGNIIKLLFKNEKFVTYIMQCESVWTVLIDFFCQLLCSRFIHQYMVIIKSILNSLAYWKPDHVTYIINKSIFKHFIQAMRTSSKKEILSIISRMIISFDIIIHNDDFSMCQSFIHSKLKPILQRRNNANLSKAEKKRINNYRGRALILKKSIYNNMKKAPLSLSSLDYIFHAQCKIIKVCNNMKCNVAQTKCTTNKFYYCKQCMLTYYCSKKCQKIDWKYNHKYICRKLRSQICFDN